jgi:hypothetical protein
MSPHSIGYEIKMEVLEYTKGIFVGGTGSSDVGCSKGVSGHLFLITYFMNGINQFSNGKGLLKHRGPRALGQKRAAPIQGACADEKGKPGRKRIHGGQGQRLVERVQYQERGPGSSGMDQVCRLFERFHALNPVSFLKELRPDQSS